jgi:hypothetical protein
MQNNNDFPRMVYKAGGTEEIHGGKFSTHIVHDAAQLDAALAGGWSKTTAEALDAAKPKASTGTGGDAGGGKPDDNAPPTRDELKQKADELKLTYPGNISNAKLAEMIDAALAGGGKQE